MFWFFFKANILLGFRKPNTVLEGWLTKQKGTSDKWDRKYFVLSGDRLVYFTPGIKGNINLTECKVEHVENVDAIADVIHSPRASRDVIIITLI